MAHKPHLNHITSYLHTSTLILFALSCPRLLQLDVSTTAKKLHLHIRITVDAREDLAWWEHFLPEWNGMAMFLDPDWTSANTLNLFTDASGTSGNGAYFNGSCSWLSHQQLGVRSIQRQKLFAIVAAAKAWGPRLAKRHVRFHCNNQAIVYA